MRVLVSAFMALAVLLSCAHTAWALEVFPATTQLSAGAAAGADGADPSQKTIDIVSFSGVSGERVFVSVTVDGEAIVEKLPHVLGEDAREPAVQGASVDVFSIVLAADGLEKVLGSDVQVTVYADRAGNTVLYTGAVHPVFANLARTQDGATATPARIIIGTRTGEAAFQAPESLLEDGVAYKLEGDALLTGTGVLQATYEEYAPAQTMEGSIRYIDVRTGETLATYTPIPGLAAGENRVVPVPETVSDGGTVYRTIAFQNSVTASNPGATSFAIPVAAFSDEQAQAAGHYLAIINMVDEDGNLIASDRVYVRGDLFYTAPDVIYKEVGTDASSPKAAAYTLAAGQEGVLNLVAGAGADGQSTYTIVYTREDAGAASVDVTFVFIDGSKRAADERARVLGTQTATVTADSPTATPPATYTAGGTSYNVVGDPSIYAYDYAKGATPVVDVYCLPEGYAPQGEEPYEVTIEYVDYATRTVIDSETFTSSPDDMVAMGYDAQGQPMLASGVTYFEPPAQIELDGVTWLLLDGQERIDHHYYSGAATYTVYYRDRSKPLESAPTISRVRVVYRDVVTTVADGGTTAAGSVAAGGAAAGTVGLAEGRSYNVVDAEDSTRVVTGQDGTDLVQERIEGDQNPLTPDASPSGGGDGTRSAAAPGLPAWGAGLLGFLIALIALIVALMRRERDDR